MQAKEFSQDNPVQRLRTPTARGSNVPIVAEQKLVAAAGMSHELDI